MILHTERNLLRFTHLARLPIRSDTHSGCARREPLACGVRRRVPKRLEHGGEPRAIASQRRWGLRMSTCAHSNVILICKQDVPCLRSSCCTDPRDTTLRSLWQQGVLRMCARASAHLSAGGNDSGTGGRGLARQNAAGLSAGGAHRGRGRVECLAARGGVLKSLVRRLGRCVASACPRLWPGTSQAV